MFPSSARGLISPRWLLVLTAAWLPAGGAVGQAYRSLPIDNSLSRQASIVKRYVKEPTGDPVSQERFQNFIRRYYLPALTQSSPEALGDLGKLRFELFRSFIWPADAAIQQQITGDAYRVAKAVIDRSEEFHPAVVYNAVLVIGMLDAQYSEDAPRPLPAANKLLGRLLAGQAAAETPLFMQAGALVGLERHARFVRGLPREQQRATVAALIAAAKRTEFPPGTRPEVGEWMRLQAAEGLARFGAAGRGGVFLKPVVGLVGDDALSLDSRARAAGLIASFKPAEAAGLDAGPLVAALKTLASDVAARYRETAEEFKRMQVERGGRQLEGILDPSRFFLEERQVRLQRRPIATDLAGVRSALRSAAPVAGDDAAAATELAKAFGAAVAVVNDDDQLDLDVADALETLADTVDGIVPRPKAAEGSAAKPEGSAAKPDAGSAAKP